MNERDLSLDDPDTLTRGEWAALAAAPPPETRSPVTLSAVAEALSVRPGWQAKGACRDGHTRMFFPGKGASQDEAKAVCAVCPVREPCLEWALATREPYGIWGGVSERGRKRMLAGRRAAVKLAAAS